MSISTILDEIHLKVIRNIWLQRFTVFNRLMLAAAFTPSGLTKALGNRFTSLPVSNPVGYFFDALYQTGFYYNFIGIAQLLAALLLLFPRTATLGALVAFPIILNICLLTISVGFRGTWVITSLMLLANIYLLCWDYDKLKPLLTFSYDTKPEVFRIAFLWESLAWGLLGAAGSGFLMIAGVGNLDRAGLWLVAVFFVLGCIFGLVSVWHRKGLRTV
jgi:glucan phosphoethanolaminetransferase (alkaline phosphatase superfamily)